MSTLKYPRLELRWRKTRPGEHDGWYWACDYMLVIAKPTVGDARCNKDGDYAKTPVEYKLNTSYRSGEEGEAYPSPGDTPFRDGVHIMWDATLLNLPAYVVSNGKRRKIKISENAKNVVLRRN